MVTGGPRYSKHITVGFFNIMLHASASAREPSRTQSDALFDLRGKVALVTGGSRGDASDRNLIVNVFTRQQGRCERGAAWSGLLLVLFRTARPGTRRT